MQEFAAAFSQAFQLIIAFDADLMEIIGLSLRVTLVAVVCACAGGFPLGALLAVGRFPGRGAAIILVNALMGLIVYMALSRAGPFGVLELLYTPAAMIIAQTILITPIVAALTQQVIHDLNAEYDEYLRSLRIAGWDKIRTLLWDARFSLMTAALAGLGRALAEVGAVLIVGGNIDHVTRVMTTAIALETSKGELALALGLGIILLVLAIAINAALMGVRSRAERLAYV